MTKFSRFTRPVTGLTAAAVARKLAHAVFAHFPGGMRVDSYARSTGGGQFTFHVYSLAGGVGVTRLDGVDLLENFYVSPAGQVEARYALHGVATTGNGEDVVCTHWSRYSRLGSVRSWEDIDALVPRLRNFLAWNDERETAATAAFAAVA